jgi:uncharacterized protein (TIGR02300 family)
MTLVKADLGTKRVCPSCNARFYDLQKRPIACPKCEFSFDPEALYKQRRPRQPEPEKARVVAEERDEEEELEDAEELEVADAEEAADVDTEGVVEEVDEDDEIVDDDEQEGAGMSVVDPAAEDETADLEDIEGDDIPEEDVEDPTLLEDVGEEEDDVSGIIDTDLEKDER